MKPENGPTGNNPQIELFKREEAQRTSVELPPEYEKIREFVAFLKQNTSEFISFKSYDGERSPEVLKHALIEMLENGLKKAEEDAILEEKYRSSKNQ